MASGHITVGRAHGAACFPCRSQLVAAMNPCRCGMAGEPGHTCRRGARCAADYQARISGPLLDRIDIRVEVPAVSAADLILPAATSAETSAVVAKRVARARETQRERFAAEGLDHVRTNAQCAPAVIERIAAPDARALAMLREAADAASLSARGYHRVLKVARTLADLDGSDAVKRIHLAEALSYRAIGEGLPLAA